MQHQFAPFAPADAAKFGTYYPSTSGIFSHALADHPLLSLEALAEAAARMNPDHVECRASDSRNGGAFAMADGGDRGVSDIIRTIGASQRWVMMRFVDQLPEYRALLDATLDKLDPIVGAKTGESLMRQAFIFISSPGTLTPFHFDPEYNILFQISGHKKFAVYPSRAPWLSSEQNELFHRSGNNLLAWQEAFEQQGMVNDLDAGDALFVPFKSPHWVRVGDTPSISLSLTWRSAWSLHQDDCYRMNGWLRHKGLTPAQPPAWPTRAPIKSLGWKLLSRTPFHRVQP